tara:strand:+ start:198 stop:638 length:441 start_codon:yes stop_codon:yes gene_type:complete
VQGGVEGERRRVEPSPHGRLLLALRRKALEQTQLSCDPDIGILLPRKYSCSNAKIDAKREHMDALLDVEEQMISAGYEDGVARGIEAGTSTGYHMGLGKGRELGAEIGQYHGQAEALMALLAVRRKQLTERCAFDTCARLRIDRMC